MAKDVRPPPLPSAQALADDILEELWFGDDDPERSQIEASQSLAAEMARLRGLKPFPVVAQRIMEMVSDPDVRLDRVCKTLETDPALCARTLRLANSALFRVGEPCVSVNQAVVRVGTKTVYELMGAVALLGMFKDVRGVGLAIRNHCVATAAIGRALVRQHGWYGGAQIFLAGLMHDVGKLLLIQTKELDYSRLPDDMMEPDRVHLHERQTIAYDHAVLGGHALVFWKITEPVPRVVAWHHQPARAYASGGDTGLMVAIVRIADKLDDFIVRGVTPAQTDWEAVASSADATYLDLDAEKLASGWAAIQSARSEALTVFV